MFLSQIIIFIIWKNILKPMKDGFPGLAEGRKLLRFWLGLMDRLGFCGEGEIYEVKE